MRPPVQGAHKCPSETDMEDGRLARPGGRGCPPLPISTAAPPDRLPSARSAIPFWRHWRFRYLPPLYSCLPCPSDRALRRTPSYLYRTESSLPESAARSCALPG